MSHTWVTGETISADLLNALEAVAGGAATTAAGAASAAADAASAAADASSAAAAAASTASGAATTAASAASAAAAAVQPTDSRLSDTRTPTDGSVTNAKVASSAAISADKLADGTTNKLLTATERTKLAGVATGATANATDAQLRDRSTHTGTQAATTITGLATVATSGVYTDLTGRPTSDGTPPSYAGTTARTFSPILSAYNVKATNTRRIRAALGQARSSQTLTRILCAGDSLTAGFLSSPGTLDYPTQLRKFLAGLGYPTGELAYAWNNETTFGGTNDSRWVLDASWVAPTPNTNGFAVANGTAIATYTSSIAGTVVDVLTFGNSANFTVQIDGGTAQTVTATGSQTSRLVSYTGLANTTHTVKITAASSGSTFLTAAGVRSTTGVQVCNAGVGAISTAGWNAAWYAPQGGSSALNPQIVLLELGMNDALTSVSASTMQTNLSTIVSFYQGQNANVILCASAAPSTTGNPGSYAALSDTAFNAYLAAIYAVADARDVPLLDLTDLFGRYTASSAVGLMGDGVHNNATGSSVKAQGYLGVLGA